LTGACDDYNACSTGDTCVAGVCQGGAPLNCDDGDSCTADSCDSEFGCVNGPAQDCSDNNPCTDDACTDTGCVNTPNAAPCNDYDACTTNDSCLQGYCEGGGSVDCDDGNACTADSCHASQGCQHEAVSCDDGNVCTADECNPASGCVTLNSFGPCDDGKPCTSDDSCDDGACVGQWIKCEDGDPCTVGEKCVDGACNGGLQLNCDDGNPCTTDSCSPSGCSHAPASGAACAVADECSVGVCVAGACEAQPITAEDLGNSCGGVPVVGVCDGHTLHKCVDGEEVVADCLFYGRVCGWNEDGMDGYGEFDCVTQDDPPCAGIPDSGVCTGTVLQWCDTDTGETVTEDCADFGEGCGWTGSYYCCHKTGSCVPLCNGKQCGDDGCGGSCGDCADTELCSENGLCLTCKPNSPEACSDGSCDDANPCTELVCDEIGGCTNQPKTDGTTCEFPAACGGGECLSGVCQPVGATPATLGDNCGDVPGIGRCDGHTLKRCDWGKLVVISCAAEGKACGWDQDEFDGVGAFGCVSQDGYICDDVPDSGMCNGSVLTYCDTDTGEAVTVDCAEEGEACGWTGSFFCCHEPVACVPQCTYMQCGDDGCGGSCGTCAEGEICSGSQVCLPCPADDTSSSGGGSSSQSSNGDAEYGNGVPPPGYGPDDPGCSASAAPVRAPLWLVVVLLLGVALLSRRRVRARRPARIRERQPRA